MLAIKHVLASNDDVSTYVFDEVDAGIGGAAQLGVNILGVEDQEYWRDRKGAGMVINSSRGILYAGDPREAAMRLRDDINLARARSGR